MEIVRVLHQIHEVKLTEMAVLTPYSAQREEIKKEMMKHRDLMDGSLGRDTPGVSVSSINESQGQMHVNLD